MDTYLKMFFLCLLLTASCGSPSNSNQLLNSESDCYKADEFICDIEHHIIRLTNQHRGTRPAQLYAMPMTFASRVWSDDQAKRGSIGHNGFPSWRYQSVITEFGSSVGVTLSAENVAMFSGGANLTAEQIAARFTTMWWNSSGHRQNMLGNHSHVGVGVTKRGAGSFYATQIFGSHK